MKLILSSLVLILLIVQYGFSQTDDCCNNFKIYGDSNNNLVSKIKHYNGNTYIIGSTELANQKFAFFTKLGADNVIIWEYRFDIQSELLDFVKTDDEAFLLIGRTVPIQTDNRSIIAKISDEGNEVFIRSYDNNQREGLFRIIKHTSPVNSNAPYYIAGYENTPGPVSYDDEVHLHNLDVNGNILWSKELTLGSDDQWSRGLIPLSDGNLLLVGDYLPSNSAIIAKISGLDGSSIRVLQTAMEASYFDGVEDSNGNIILAGRFGLSNPSGILSLFDSDLNFISSTKFQNQAVELFKELEIDSEDSLYCIGLKSNNGPIICKAKKDGSLIIITSTKYFENDESEYKSPCLDVIGSTLYYADARLDHPLSFGGYDILLGYFDTELDAICLSDTILITNIERDTIFPVIINERTFTAPNPISEVNLVSLSLNCQSISTFVIDSLTIETCPSVPVEYNGEVYEAGSINEVLIINIEGCQTILILSIEELAISNQILQFEECQGGFYDYNGTEILAGSQEIFTFSDSNGCDSIITVIVNIADIIEEEVEVELCEGEEYTFNSVEYPIGTDTTIQLIEQNGCERFISISILLSPDLDYELVAEDACEGMDDGSITIQNIQGGVPPYSFSIDGQSYFMDTSLNGLPPNVYNFQVIDSNQCSYDQSFEIKAIPEFSIDYVVPFISCEDDSVLLEIKLQPISENEVFWTWSDGSEGNFIYVSQPGYYGLELSNRCQALIESFNIQFEEEEDKVNFIYIPNSFSPNLDGINDYFQLYPIRDIELLNFEVKIYDRWGSELFTSNDINFSWDGTYKGKDLNSGVYVWWVKSNIISCRQDIDFFKKGDLTITR